MNGVAAQPRLRGGLILLLVWFISGLYAGSSLKRGWFPWDIGAYAQSADRVLHGELPHRDYIDTYTGGLAFLNAFAFRYLGENLATPRLVLFVVFLAWIPAVFWVASEFVADWVAGGITLLAVAWSLPNYPEAVPSWYNLIFATLGLASLLAFLRRPAPKWLFCAGLCGGFSFLAKSIGLTYVAAVFLFFVFREQDETPRNENGAKQSSIFYKIFVAASIGLFLILLTGLVLRRFGLAAFLLFVVPSASLAFVLLRNEGRIRGRADQARFAALMRMSAVFGLGLATPILIFLVPYVQAHAVRFLLRDLLHQASLRISRVYTVPPIAITIVPTLLLAGALLTGAKLRGMRRGILVAAVAALFAVCLLVAGRNEIAFHATFFSAYWAIVPLALTGDIVLSQADSNHDRLRRLKRQQLFLLLSMAALCSLVQLPYPAFVYTCYAAPLVLLATVALLALFPSLPRPLLVVLFVSFLLFAVFRMTPIFMYNMATEELTVVKPQILDLPRAGNLRVDPSSAAVYEKLIPLIQEHAGTGEIYAAPDCPEIYFLAGYRNPTRDIYDFLDDQAGRKESVLKLLDSHPIRVVVLNGKPFASNTVPEDLHGALAQRFPAQETVGYFEVRWRP
jgi:hypothetical protein